MDWVFDNIPLLLFIAAGIAQMLLKKKAPEDAPEAPPAEASFEDPQLAERTRKIREDIQRKIEDRRRADSRPQPAPAPQAEASPEQPPEWIRELPPVVQEVFQTPRQTAAHHAELQRQAELLERQATLAEQLRQAQAMKAAVQKRTTFETAISEKDGAKGRSQRALIGELRDPAALRRAFVLREVLGPPIALRR